MDRDVLQLVSREIPKPVIECIVQEELNQQKS